MTPLGGQRAARGDCGVHRVTRGRDQRERSLALQAAPVLSLADPPLELERLRLVAFEREDRPREVRERREIADPLELCFRQERRERHPFRIDVDRAARDQRLDCRSDLFEPAAAAVDAVDAARDKQPGRNQFREEGGPRAPRTID